MVKMNGLERVYAVDLFAPFVSLGINGCDAAARAGFKGVELQAPYPLEIDQIVERLEKNNLKHVIINSPVRDPDMRKGNIALLPDRMDLYQERTAQAAQYASGLGCMGVNIGCGPIDEIDPDEARFTYIANIRQSRCRSAGRIDQHAGSAGIFRQYFTARS